MPSPKNIENKKEDFQREKENLNSEIGFWNRKKGI